MPKGVTSLEGFIRKVAKLHQENIGSQLYFRGHSNSDYSISPSIFRTANHVNSEHLMIRQLLAQHPKEFADDTGILDQLVRAQHYGLPTRLLDITLNPLVALYFSCSSSPSKRGSVVVFKPNIGKQKFFDSDAVSCLCALSLLTQGEKEEIQKNAIRAINEGKEEDVAIENRTNWIVTDAALEKFNDTKEIQKLVQMVRHEKPDFRPIVQPIDLIKPAAVLPRKHHSRIIAQNGAFIVFGLAYKANKINMDHILSEVIHIEQSCKEKFIKELGQVGITESSLFPEIEKAAIAIRRRYS